MQRWKIRLSTVNQSGFLLSEFWLDLRCVPFLESRTSPVRKLKKRPRKNHNQGLRCVFCAHRAQNTPKKNSIGPISALLAKVVWKTLTWELSCETSERSCEFSLLSDSTSSRSCWISDWVWLTVFEAGVWACRGWQTTVIATIAVIGKVLLFKMERS